MKPTACRFWPVCRQFAGVHGFQSHKVTRCHPVIMPTYDKGCLITFSRFKAVMPLLVPWLQIGTSSQNHTSYGRIWCSFQINGLPLGRPRTEELSDKLLQGWKPMERLTSSQTDAWTQCLCGGLSVGLLRVGFPFRTLVNRLEQLRYVEHVHIRYSQTAPQLQLS